MTTKPILRSTHPSIFFDCLSCLLEASSYPNWCPQIPIAASRDTHWLTLAYCHWMGTGEGSLASESPSNQWLVIVLFYVQINTIHNKMANPANRFLPASLNQTQLSKMSFWLSTINYISTYKYICWWCLIDLKTTYWHCSHFCDWNEVVRLMPSLFVTYMSDGHLETVEI